MLRVTVEIVPYGDETLRRTISTMTCGLRTDSDLPQYGDYDVKVDGKEFRIERHKRADGAWELVRRAVEHHVLGV